MQTPICDFVRDYARKRSLRMHMPGHKGVSLLGMEHLDITEITGADSLYEANGVIRESEQNASSLFGCPTFYSTEGSSQCIRAMLYLVLLHAKNSGRRPLIAAGRNAHKTFLSAAALLDLEVVWLTPESPDSYLSCRLDANSLERQLSSLKEKPIAVYLTSPDYLGNTADVLSLSALCRRLGILLVVDNAHGAYLRFLPESQHPVDLGADMCCDSAHKTLPALTGGAYLHIAPNAPALFCEQAKNALALFGSTSPSYLILQSLDAVNRLLAEGYRDKLTEIIKLNAELKTRLVRYGYTLRGDEPAKLTIDAKPFGYEGVELLSLLEAQNIFCEFADPDFLVLMISPETGRDGMNRLSQALLSIPKKVRPLPAPPPFHLPAKALSIREAMFSPSETLPLSQCDGRILSSPGVACPPAVPIVVCGETIDSRAIESFRYYHIDVCRVVRES